MHRLVRVFGVQVLNAGTPLLLMGSMWLLLWVFPWRLTYVAEPHWGHNYTESLAFLCLGLAYFNRRFLSDLLGLLASVLVIPAALELLPHPITASLGAFLFVLTVVDMLFERGRKEDLGQSSNRRLAMWLKKHLMRFAFIFLAHIPLIYYLVRLPAGTYEVELVTKVYNGMLLVFIILALLEGAVQTLWGAAVSRLAFFWGLLTIIVALAILRQQPETWPFLGLSLLIAALAIVSLVANRQNTGSAMVA